MKVHKNGQVVIPAHIRRRLGIKEGDHLQVEIVEGEGRIELRVPVEGRARALAGSLRRYARERLFPSDDEMAEALRRGLGADG